MNADTKADLTKNPWRSAQIRGSFGLLGLHSSLRPTATDQRLVLRASRVGQQRDVAGLFDRRRQPALMRRADTGQPAWHNLATFRYKLREQANVFVIDRLDLLHAEFADFLAAKVLAPAFARPPGAAPRAWTARPKSRPAVASGSFRPCCLSFGSGGRFWCCNLRFFCHDAPQKIRRWFLVVGRARASRYPAIPINTVHSWSQAHGQRPRNNVQRLNRCCCGRLSASFGCCRRGGRLAARIAYLLNLVESLLLLVDAHGEELDHRLRYAQTAFQFMDQRSRPLNGQQNVHSILESADHIRQPPLAQPFHALHIAAGRGDLVFQRGNQFVEILVRHIRPNDKHQFISTIHSASPNSATSFGLPASSNSLCFLCVASCPLWLSSSFPHKGNIIR